MNNRQWSILWIGCILIAVFGHILPSSIGARPSYALSNFPIESFETYLRKSGLAPISSHTNKFLGDKLPTGKVEDALKALLKPKAVKRGQEPGTRLFSLGRGISLPNYLFMTQEKLQELDCAILGITEIKPYDRAARIRFKCNAGREQVLFFEIGDEYLANSSRLAVIFSHSHNLSDSLTKILLRWQRPYALALNPFALDSTTPTRIANLQNPLLIAQIPMDTVNNSNTKTANQSIRFYHTTEEANRRLDNALRSYPAFKGLLPIGRPHRTLNNESLRETLLKFAHTNQLFVLSNLGKHQFPNLSQECTQAETDCADVHDCTDTTRIDLHKCVQDNVRRTLRTSQNILVVPLSSRAIQALEDAIQTYQPKGLQVQSLEGWPMSIIEENIDEQDTRSER